MDILYISGSPRKNSNTDMLLKLALSITGGDFIKLADYHIEPCISCRVCQKLDDCIIEDDMKHIIIPMLLESVCIVIGSPVFFNNVSAQTKAFIDRTWCIRGKLKNKIGGAIVVGRRYGAENAITAINAFFLKHEMIIANRGVCGLAFDIGEIEQDYEAIKATEELAERIIELGGILR
ncbi:MAG: flavodoxin family protein [bacterium]|jgi:multimeric flavodoxin WrbA